MYHILNEQEEFTMMVRFGAKKRSQYGGAVSETHDIHLLSESDLATVNGGRVVWIPDINMEPVSNKQRCYVCNKIYEASRVTCPKCGCKLS